MKVLRIFFLLLATIILWVAVRQYFFCPSYSFTDNPPFSGNQWYNPYSTISQGNWIKCNFHAHTNAWAGISNGHGGAEDVWKAYDSLGYAVRSISEYHKINNTYKDSINYISAYEHGYNIQKTHQLVIGDYEVLWLDYIFPQTLSNKQNILNKLSYEKDNVIFVNHPGMRNGYTGEDMRHLTNYNCIEILNPQAISISQWDAALSAGIPVFGVGDDDMHNVFHPGEMGRYCTWLNVPAVNKGNIMTALKEGHGYAMIIPQKENEDHFARQERIRSELPMLKQFTITGDTLQVEMNKPAKEIKFAGQNGKQLATITDTPAASYILKSEDSYVRTEIEFDDGTKIFLNPVFRHNGSPLVTKAGYSFNIAKTIFFFIIGLVLLVVWGLYVIRQLFRRHYRSKKERSKVPAYPIE